MGFRMIAIIRSLVASTTSPIKRLPLLFAVACGLACNGPTRPTQEVLVSVAGDTVAATVVRQNSGDYLHFDLRVTIDNRSTATIAYQPCFFAIEGNSGSGWSHVWSSPCSLTGVGDPQLAPGETREITFTVHAAVGDPGLGEKWNSPSLNGTYRFVTVAHAVDGTTSVTVTPSNAFVVRTTP